MVDLKNVSEEVKSNEPETVQYQITQSDEDENEILIWEEVSRVFPSWPPGHPCLASYYFVLPSRYGADW